MIQIQNPHFTIKYDEGLNKLSLIGKVIFKENKTEMELNELFKSINDKHPSSIEIDLEHAIYLDTFGSNMLYRNLIRWRKANFFSFKISGSDAISWQDRFMINCKRIFPATRLEYCGHHSKS